MIVVKSPVVVICVFLWIGFVCGISFLEAWLKFRAPGITVPLALGIGQLVFNALNKVEWVFAIIILCSMMFSSDTIWKWKNLLFLTPFAILLVQTFWLLPVLDLRAEQVIHGADQTPSGYHIYFIGAEVIKVVTLSVFGISLFKRE